LQKLWSRFIALSHSARDACFAMSNSPSDKLPSHPESDRGQTAGSHGGNDDSPHAEQSHPPQQDDLANHREQRRPSKPLYKRPVLMLVLIVILIAIAIGGFQWWQYERQFESTDDAFIDGNIVQLAPKISGYVNKLLVTDNQLVHAGDLLLEIDPRDYQVALAMAEAAQASADGSVAQAKARVDAAQAQATADEAEVASAQATAKNAQQDYQRNASLAPRAVSQQTLESSAATASSSQAEVAAARARADSAAQQVRLAKSQLETAQADQEQAKVKVDQAKLNLSYTKIFAPIEGRVTHRTVDAGNYVEPGQPLFALVDPNLWVTANFKETQLNHMQVGQPVEVRVDAFPNRKLAAHVDSFQRGSGARFSALPPENATGNYVKVVQRIPVKIVFNNPPPADMVLGPGMSVVPRVTIDASADQARQTSTTVENSQSPAPSDRQ
jgi:membrane fusion protein, multidrug efflux system